MARTGLTISKTDKLKAELGSMSMEERRAVADYIRYLNILESKQSWVEDVEEAPTKKRKAFKRTAKRTRKPRTARMVEAPAAATQEQAAGESTA